jgi:hypothetical protein
MLSFKQYLEEAKKGRCWTGYKPVPGKVPYSDDSCEKIKEDGGAVAAAPTNVVGNGAIAGTGGKGGEPGVSKKRNPVMKALGRRSLPNM